MRIPRDNIGRFIDYEDFLNRELWISFYYDYGECYIDLTPTKIIIAEINANNRNFEFKCDDLNKELEIYKIKRTVGNGGVEFFNTENEAKEFYNKLIQDDIDEYKDRINNLLNKLL